MFTGRFFYARAHRVILLYKEQHKEVSQNHMKRDATDTRRLLDYKIQVQPFWKVKELGNIVNGVTASDNVNVDEAKKVGQSVLLYMTRNFSDMFSKPIHTKNGSFSTKHKQLFQRLTVVF
ncbi:hypothetical protein PR048_014122 [Dryococelus australis]|uniref:Uncharacterized protein n=1 Tax=Dryococelus australis TaxID=614101 RepID=A0ABQ9HDH5_9NEOP|nr:hypothetical protein PR048_014122 [Dryococelus australis]